MKRFIVSILCVSVFFIGLGSLVKKAGARFKSDARALELVKQARTAIGGEAAINNVRSMTIVGTSVHTFNVDGVARNENGSLEINFELPNKFDRKIRIGNPENASGELRKEIDVTVLRKDVDNLRMKTENGDDLVLNGERKITVKKADGTTEEINVEGNKRFVVKQLGEGEAGFRIENGEAPGNGERKVFVEKLTNGKEFIGIRGNELFRTAFALLLTAPEGTEASYVYAGESMVDGFSCDIIEVQSNGASFRLFLDKSSHLPRMMSYQAPRPFVIKLDKSEGGEPGTRVIARRDFPKPEMAEFQIKFSDYRSVSGVQLPHRWTQTIGGEMSENIDITSYEINPANIAEKFQNHRVMIRTEKPQ